MYSWEISMVISKKLDGAKGIRRSKEKIARCISSLKKIIDNILRFLSRGPLSIWYLCLTWAWWQLPTRRNRPAKAPNPKEMSLRRAKRRGNLTPCHFERSAAKSRNLVPNWINPTSVIQRRHRIHFWFFHCFLISPFPFPFFCGNLCP